MTWTDPNFESIVRLLGARTGLSIPLARHGAVETGIRRAMSRAGGADLRAYCALLEADAAAFDDLVVELTIGETYFFREPDQFAYLRCQVLPEVRSRRGAEHGIRVWSAACASGEEAYSLAIVLLEAGLAGGAHLVATDISRAALARARQAVYRAWSLRGAGAADVRPYLRPQGDDHVLVPSIRRLVQFHYLNLALDVYPSFASGIWGMDVILCRNVLIYFDPDTVQAVARRLFETLAPGGWLFTASSDPSLAGLAPFETVVTDQGVFYRRGPVAAAPASAAPPSWVPAPAAPQPASVLQRPTTPTPVVPSPHDLLAAARQALHDGDYRRAAALTADLGEDAEACVVHVRALANFNAGDAARVCAAATVRHPLAPELHYLHALLLLEQEQLEDAAGAIRRVLYLDRALAMAHFTLGSILERRGDLAGARRAYRNARDLCAAQPADAVVRLADGEHAGRLAEAAAAQLAILEAAEATP